MEGSWDWRGIAPQTTAAATSQGQGKWESHDYGESSGWGVDDWDQSNTGDDIHTEEFANIMNWDDSGALNALEIVQKRNEERSKGLVYSVSLPSPDLYIQAIDWDSREDLNLPNPAGSLSPLHGERKGQRKRGRKAGGGFRRQFDKQEISHAFQWRQDNNPSSQTREKVQLRQEHNQNHGLGASTLQTASGVDPRDKLTHAHVPLQDWSQRKWPTQQSSYQKQSSGWYNSGRGHFYRKEDGQQNWQVNRTAQRWRSNTENGRGQGDDPCVPYWSPNRISSDPCFQSNRVVHGADWILQPESNVQSGSHERAFGSMEAGPLQAHAQTRQQQRAVHVPSKIHGLRTESHLNNAWQYRR
ncbi:hypothetical protein KP509_13G078300 [Ceratopteris richardii]|uniref:Uncharacterized protein n=1 Tax=Ceratopteris richardii TaxID=49495 RepID=A0A8T2TH52_CERRI|nr:hypothetical protein KP509_13G078300 [Ceratopteris richardii]